MFVFYRICLNIKLSIIVFFITVILFVKKNFFYNIILTIHAMYIKDAQKAHPKTLFLR
jgi:hypothetical protein